MLIFGLFCPCARSNLLTASFILVKLLYFKSITTYCWLLVIVQSLLLSFLISLLLDRKSTRLNSSHVRISYAVFCLKKQTISRPAVSLPHTVEPPSRQR